MTDVATEGPFEVDVKVHITNGDQAGVVTVGMAKGETPTREQIRNAVTEAEKAAKAQGFRLMDRHEFIIEQMGVGRMAVPGPKTFPNE